MLTCRAAVSGRCSTITTPVSHSAARPDLRQHQSGRTRGWAATQALLTESRTKKKKPNSDAGSTREGAGLSLLSLKPCHESAHADSSSNNSENVKTIWRFRRAEVHAGMEGWSRRTHTHTLTQTTFTQVPQASYAKKV